MGLIKIQNTVSTLSLCFEKRKRKVLCTGRRQVQASNGSFCQLSFFSTKCYTSFTVDEYSSCVQKDPGWLQVGCRHFKVILLPHLCLCCSSAYFQFSVGLGKRLILDLECALPEGSKRDSGREIKPVSLCLFAECALWQ